MTQSQNRIRKPIFISIRWRFILPLALVITLIAMIGTYILAARVADGFAVSEDNLLIQSSQTIANRSITLYDRQRSEAQRVAFTQGIAENIILNDVLALHQTLETLARTANLDSIVVTDPAGLEVAGVLRVRNSDPIDYSISSQSDLRAEAIVRAVIDDDAIGTTGFIQTPQGLMLNVAVPIINDGSFAGVALVGQLVPTVVQNLRASAIAQLTIYDASGNAFFTSLPLDNATLDNLSVTSDTIAQTLQASTPVVATTTFSTTRYRTLYTPFTYGDRTLGVSAILIPDNLPFVSALGRQLSALFAAILTGASVFLTFIVVDRYAARLTHVQQTATALIAGQRDARTGLQASDEIGAVGAALDQFANVTQYREDQLRTQLWRQRRERNYMVAVFEAIPEGVIVQDRDGEIVMMNDIARHLLGGQTGIEKDIAALSRNVPQMLGKELAPGIYALGDPRQIKHAGRMVKAQAAALLTHNQQRIGTVMLLHDVTQEIQEKQARDKLLDQLSADIQQPLAAMAHDSHKQSSGTAIEFAREISRHAASLQKMIVDMRELTRYSPEHARTMQRPLLAETLIYAVANDWRQIAQAVNLELRVNIEEAGHYILGDESRLRWAIGNIVDNAIKYTPVGGIIAIEIKAAKDGRLHMRVRDNGVGISDDDLKLVFMEFYRGTPLQADGTLIHAPGMGQGLPLARQVIRAHGGLMKVKSRVGVGSAIYIALPITSGSHYSLPLLDNADMDGETMRLAEDVDIDAIWKRQ
ncbi:MAG: ATP-binding protein [Phototrophicaceae bacterium]